MATLCSQLPGRIDDGHGGLARETADGGRKADADVLTVSTAGGGTEDEALCAWFSAFHRLGDIFVSCPECPAAGCCGSESRPCSSRLASCRLVGCLRSRRVGDGSAGWPRFVDG